jgi:predicted  nucleic acid-binding Zn-ribbon protein
MDSALKIREQHAIKGLMRELSQAQARLRALEAKLAQAEAERDDLHERIRCCRWCDGEFV